MRSPALPTRLPSETRSSRERITSASGPCAITSSGCTRDYCTGNPTAQGYRHWSSLMLSLRKTDAQVYSAFVQSPAFRAANAGGHFLPDVVTRTFQTLLGREPTREELKGGEAYLRSGHSLASFATQFLTSEEFTANGYAQNVQHTVVVYQENWSFDGLFGLFPGVNGIADASPVSEQQVMQDGTPYQTLPPSNDANVSLASLPFNLAAYRSPSEITGDPAHAFYQEQAQINGGLMNKFVAWGYYTGSTEYNGTNDVMSYYDSRHVAAGTSCRRVHDRRRLFSLWLWRVVLQRDFLGRSRTTVLFRADSHRSHRSAQPRRDARAGRQRRDRERRDRDAQWLRGQRHRGSRFPRPQRSRPLSAHA